MKWIAGSVCKKMLSAFFVVQIFRKTIDFL